MEHIDTHQLDLHDVDTEQIEARQGGAEQVDEVFGWSMSVDIHGCDVERLEDGEVIADFSQRLCDDVLDMVRYGEPLIEWFGMNEPKTAGYSLVQLIETSSVVGHFSGHRRSAHLDVFSCKPYDADAVEKFCVEFFGATDASVTFIERD